ncbi:MAG TPA: dipeptidase [Solirubrobacteraceae bacterium]|jgi:membrane dipeptidase|nr:dipeptidase [Solirubrobacteraceae bacterium]
MTAVFDGHNDALTREDHARLVSGRDGGHLDLPRMRAGRLRGGIFAVFTASPDFDWTLVERADGVLEYAPAQPVSQLEAAASATRAAGRLAAMDRAGHLRIARSVSDLDAVRADDDGPPAAVLHIEGAEAIDPELEALEHWYAAGLRSLGPVWSRSNAFGHGVPFIFPAGPDTGPGLTPAGQALVARCAELGIMVDLSHLNEKGFWDVARAEPGPLVASHSGVHALAASSRNLTDEQLDAIGSSDGLVGIIFGCQFVRADLQDDADTPLSVIAQHAAHVAERIGVRHVALGSDFDGTRIPAELGDVAGIPKLLDALRDAGFSEPDLEAIAWENWRRVLGVWWR